MGTRQPEPYLVETIRRGLIEVGRSRMVLFDIHSGFHALRDRLEMLAGGDAAERVLYQAGIEGGVSFTRTAQQAGLVGTGASGFRDGVWSFGAAGFGDYTIEALDMSARRARISCPDAFESWAFRQHGRLSDRPVCDYSAGVLLSFMQVMTGDLDLECTEPSCMARGDPACIFDIEPREGTGPRQRPIESWDVAALARENARLRAEAERRADELDRRNRELGSLIAVAATLAQSIDLDEALEGALRRSIEVVAADAGGIYIIDQDADHLVLARHQGISPPLARSLGRIPIGDQPAWVVARTGQSVEVQHLASDSRANMHAIAGAGFRHFLGVPLYSRDRVVGVMVVLWLTPAGLSDARKALLEAIGHHIGVAIENARLFRSSQQVAAAEERNRLARDLHDSVTQALFSMTLTSGSLWRLLAQAPAGDPTAERLRPLVSDLSEIASEALEEMRALIFQLRPVGLDGQNLPDALARLLAWTERRENLAVDLTVGSLPAGLTVGTQVEEALFRIAQEAINNAVHHAGATRVRVVLDIDGESARLSVRDDGTGFEPEVTGSRRPDGRGFGLTGMRERAALLGGSVMVQSKPGHGTTVRAEIPMAMVRPPE